MDWIKENSVTKLCPELDLSWEENSFNLLGVTFSKNLNEITDLNYTQKIKEIYLLFQTYSKRILTPIGKIVVIKTLALPKINHLIMSLPNPNGHTITPLQNLCYTFLWNSGPDILKGNVLRNRIIKGAENFMVSLKVTWIRRMITTSNRYLNLVSELFPFTTPISNFGCNFVKLELHRVTSLFWF